VSVDILKDRTEDLNQLQRELSLPRRKARVENFVEVLSNTDITQLARFKSCVGFQNEAGLWLEAVPKYAALTMSHSNFQTAIRLRLGLDQNLPTGMTCACKKVIEPKGYHLISGCNSGGDCTATHDAVCNEIQQWVRSVGLTSKREDTKIFEGMAYHSRPDLTIDNAPLFTKPKLVIDTVISNPTNGKLSKAMASIVGRAGKAAIAFESFGTISEKGLAFFNALGRLGVKTSDISFETLHKYWLKRISICLQNKITDSILKKCYKFCNSKVTYNDKSLSRFAILEFIKLMSEEQNGSRFCSII